MCGISVIANLKTDPMGNAIERMVVKLTHRGPDSFGFRHLPSCHLGHTRLSIIDLSSGGQPMSDWSGRYWISYNGEIYNYGELRQELVRKGHRFNTRSDTEVIIASYAEWDQACLDRFRGMFAFVIWDTQERKLFAARDLFGEKPLYYAFTPDGSLFLASELKALIASGMIQPRLDFYAVDAYLALGYVPPDQTIFKNVHTLPPGHFLEWSGENVSLTRYWLPKLEVRPISMEEASEILRELLQRAVSRQMVSDVPVGAYLSGGLDSSTIVALMQMQNGRPIKSFSVGFGDYINELPYARSVAELYKTDHHEIDLGMPPVAEMLLRMAAVYDEPFADSSHIPTYLISEFARRYVKVVLSGDGGDELFGGYSWWYLPLAMSEKVSPSWLKWVVLRSVSSLMKHRWRRLSLYSAACGLAARWPDMWMRQVMGHMHMREPFRRRLWGDQWSRVRAYMPGDYYRPNGGSRGMNKGFYFDLTSYLPGDILVKVDRAAMAHGLETRVPFLDRDLVEFALSLPANLKVNGEETKIILRQACSQYWPPELRGRQKQGFGAPLDVWLRFPDVRALTDRVFADGSSLRNLLPGLSPEQRHRNTNQTWILLTLGLWLESNPVI